MKFTELKRVHDFCMKILNDIDSKATDAREVKRLCHNGRIDVGYFLDNDCDTKNCIQFILED